MILWIVAAITLWRHASKEGVADYWRWIAVAVALPLLAFVIGHHVNKQINRRR